MDDITPSHNPIGLARDMEKVAINTESVAGLYILIDKDGHLKYDACGNENQQVLWALEIMKFNLMRRMEKEENTQDAG